MQHGPNPSGGASLKAQLRRAFLLLASLALLASAVLITTAVVQQKAMDRLLFAFRGALIASDLEDDLVRLTRIYQLRVQGQPAEQEEGFLIARIRSNLEQARLHVADPVEESVVVNLTAAFEGAASRLQKPNLTPQEHLDIWMPAYERIRSYVSALVALNRSLVASVLIKTESWNRVVTILSIAIVVVLAASVFLLTRATKRHILDPLYEYVNAVNAFRSGQQNMRAPESGPRELARIGRAFNELADDLKRQRDDQMRFIASVVHDFRNPLAALKNASALLLRNKSIPDDPTIRKAMEISARQVDRLSRIADDLMDVTRLESGRLELRMRSCDWRDVVSESVDLYRNVSEIHELRLRVPEEPVVIQGDPARLVQVLNNLLSNAIKYSPQGGTVDVSLSVEGDQAVLAVTDQGIGMDPKEFGSLFEPFYRLSGARETIPGVGLGLWVVSRIVEAHHGKIDVQSQKGIGSTFTIRLSSRHEPSPPTASDDTS